MTLIVNCFGAPGAGKSTTSTGVFHYLKLANINAEYVSEYAKNLVYEDRGKTLECQPYVFGKQLRDLERVIGQVDVAITDSPILLSRYYGERYCKDRYPASFFQFVTEQFKAMPALNYYIERVKPYNPKGRNQTEGESDEVAEQLRDLLDRENILYKPIKGDAGAAQTIVTDVMQVLKNGGL